MIRWMHGSVWKLLVIGPALWLTPPVGAQESVREELVPVDAFVEDASGLSTSLRDVQYGIQVPFGFEQLMREDTPAGRYVRRAAGLWAVFPRSEYVVTGSGYIATWPADTRFHIGPPRRSEPAAIVPIEGSEGRMIEVVDQPPIVAEVADAVLIEAEPSDGRTVTPPPVVDTNAGRDRPAPPKRIELIRVPFVVDARYRSTRIRSIVERANRASAQAARGPSPSSSK